VKKLLVGSTLLMVAVIAVGLWSRDQTPRSGSSAVVIQRASQPSQEQNQMREYATKGRVPAYYTSTADMARLPPTLSPELFTGNKKLAYQAAKEIPETLAQLPCYCHCDRGHNHKSLHSCFESEHGENCGICIGEALVAYNLQKQGVAVSEIRKQIIATYG
jgi:hypothetical protein